MNGNVIFYSVLLFMIELVIINKNAITHIHRQMTMGGPYLTKSFFNTRMRIVARNPVRRRTVTQEFIIENQ